MKHLANCFLKLSGHQASSYLDPPPSHHPPITFPLSLSSPRTHPRRALSSWRDWAALLSSATAPCIRPPSRSPSICGQRHTHTHRKDETMRVLVIGYNAEGENGFSRCSTGSFKCDALQEIVPAVIALENFSHNESSGQWSSSPWCAQDHTPNL